MNFTEFARRIEEAHELMWGFPTHKTIAQNALSFDPEQWRKWMIELAKEKSDYEQAKRK